jgi:hypothetical protein
VVTPTRSATASSDAATSPDTNASAPDTSAHSASTHWGGLNEVVKFTTVPPPSVDPARIRQARSSVVRVSPYRYSSW